MVATVSRPQRARDHLLSGVDDGEERLKAF